MAAYLNIAERILRVAEEQGDRAAFILPDRVVSYARLRQLILAYAETARIHGIGSDSIVAIDIDNPVYKTALALACLLVHAPWVDATTTMLQQQTLAYTHLLFGTAKSHEPSPTRLMVDASWSMPARASFVFDAGSPDDIWTYTQSSGTTGTPKFTAVAERLVDGGFGRGFGTPEGQRVVAAFLAPVTTAGITTYAVRVLVYGGTLVSGEDLDLMLRSGVNRVSGSPVQFAKLLEGKRKPTWKIYAGQVTGAAMAESQFARMLDFFEQVQVWYGTTEMGVVAERAVTSLPVDTTNVGKMLSEVEIEVVDDQDRPVPAGAEGVVRIRRADRKSAGYVGAEDATKTIFRDGWFYPGDIGRFSDAGDLHIVGRSDDRLNLGGVKVDAGRVDNVVQNIKGVRDGYCFADRDESDAVYLALLLDLEDDLDAGMIIDEIVAAMHEAGLRYRIRRVYLTGDVPRTSTGKPVRRLAGEFVRKQKLINVVPPPPKR